MDAQAHWFVAGWATLHLLGLFTAWASRLPLRSAAARMNQGVLLAAFLAITATAVLHRASGYQLSLLSATTLAVMAVGAVCECRRETEDVVLSRVIAAYE